MLSSLSGHMFWRRLAKTQDEAVTWLSRRNSPDDIMSFIVQWRACPMLWIEYGPWLLLILTIPSQMHNIFQSNSSGFIKNLSQHFMFEQCHRLSGRDNPTCKFIVSMILSRTIMDIDEEKRPCLYNMCKTRQYRMSRHYPVLRDWWPVYGWAEAPLPV